MARKKRKPPEKVRAPEAQTGVATGGTSIDPWGLPEEPAIETGAQHKAAPPPGVPVSEDEYGRMKEAAKNKRSRAGKHAQEDPSSAEKK
jgi:hypothetical protein